MAAGGGGAVFKLFHKEYLVIEHHAAGTSADGPRHGRRPLLGLFGDCFEFSIPYCVLYSAQVYSVYLLSRGLLLLWASPAWCFRCDRDRRAACFNISHLPAMPGLFLLVRNISLFSVFLLTFLVLSHFVSIFVSLHSPLLFCFSFLPFFCCCHVISYTVWRYLHRQNKRHAGQRPLLSFSQPCVSV